MGHIWEARDLQLERRVAVKLIAGDYPNARLLQWFEREARAIARLSNPNVIQIYDYGIDAGTPYLVMEFLPGEDLEERLKRQHRVPLPLAVPMVQQIARALGAAHEAGIIHRDLKPANIFLARGDAEETLKVLDFGLVALPSEKSEIEETVAGTPAYMSPEQLRSAQPDRRTDLWSLGVIIYRMLTGVDPFVGESLGDLIVRICTDPFTPATQVVPELPPGVDAFFEKALAKDPSKRFASARELASAFAAIRDSAGRGPIKILVIDDEADVQLLVRQRFRRQIRQSLYEFLFASDGQAGLEQLTHHPDVDLVLSDINMPGMDGLTFLTQVSSVNPIAKTVMVSAYGDMSNIRMAMNRGAFDFLLKPLDFQDLEATIDKTVKFVAALREKARSDEENQFLRTLVSPTVLERLQAAGATGAMLPEAEAGSVVVFDLHLIGRERPVFPAEDLVRRLNANFEVLVPEIVAHEGRVERFFNDILMAVFRGEDHVARALETCVTVRAHLASIARRAGSQAPYSHTLGIGLSTGELIASGLGSRAFGRMDFEILGEAGKTAVRLAQQAAPGQILLCRAVHEALPSRFQGEPVTHAQDGAPLAEATYQLLERPRASEPATYAETMALGELDTSLEIPAVRR